jgi:hypothetical protein
LSCFVEIAPRKTRAKAAEEEKQRTANKSDLIDRLGSKDASTPSWYDSTPPINSSIRSWNRAWTLAGDKAIPGLPRLVGLKKDGKSHADMGYAIRVSTSVENWDPSDSDYVYIDVHNQDKSITSVMRLAVKYFMWRGFDFFYDDMIGGYEDKQKATFKKTIKASKARDYGKFISEIEGYLNAYYSVRFMIIML